MNQSMQGRNNNPTLDFLNKKVTTTNHGGDHQSSLFLTETSNIGNGKQVLLMRIRSFFFWLLWRKY